MTITTMMARKAVVIFARILQADGSVVCNDFTDKFCNRWCDEGMRARMVKSIKDDSVIKKELDAFKASIPSHFAKCELSTARETLVNMETLLKRSSDAGDYHLATQVRFLGMVTSVSNVVVDMTVAEVAGEGGDPEMNDANVKLLIEARTIESSCSKMLAGPGFESAFQAVAETRGVNFTDLDGFLDPVAIGKLAHNTLRDAISRWCSGWKDLVAVLVQEVNSSCPDGWSAVKNGLMRQEHVETRKALLGNSKYTQASEATESLSAAFEFVKQINTRGGGPIFDAAFVKEATSQLKPHEFMFVGGKGGGAGGVRLDEPLQGDRSINAIKVK